MKPSQRFSLENCVTIFFLFATVLFGCSNGPKITKFEAGPREICYGDTIRANWDINGTPTMLISMSDVAEDPGTAPVGDMAPRYLTMTLVVHKGNNDDVVQRVQVEMLPPSSKNTIAFNTILREDTLVAAGTKNLKRWGDRFQIATVASGSDRKLFVRHGGKMVQLEEDGTPSNGLAGMALEGDWEIFSLLTSAERQDTTTAPDRLKVEATIQCKINK